MNFGPQTISPECPSLYNVYAYLQYFLTMCFFTLMIFKLVSPTISKLHTEENPHLLFQTTEDLWNPIHCVMSHIVLAVLKITIQLRRAMVYYSSHLCFPGPEIIHECYTTWLQIYFKLSIICKGCAYIYHLFPYKISNEYVCC